MPPARHKNAAVWNQPRHMMQPNQTKLPSPYSRENRTNPSQPPRYFLVKVTFLQGQYP